MAVIDTNSLAESIKQNATMVAILENGKALWDTTKEGLEATKQITDTVGGAVSLALTAQSFITNANQLLQCVTPQFLLDGMNFEVTNICTAQDYIRSKRLKHGVRRGGRQLFLAGHYDGKQPDEATMAESQESPNGLS